MNSTLNFPSLTSKLAVTALRSSRTSFKLPRVSFSRVRVISEFMDFCWFVFSCLILDKISWKFVNSFEGSESSLYSGQGVMCIDSSSW